MIAARLIGQGTHTGPFDGMAPTGRRISTQELVIYRFADGKIAQCWGDFFPVVRDAMMAAADAERCPSAPSSLVGAYAWPPRNRPEQLNHR
jgi:hypothetical protein